MDASNMTTGQITALAELAIKTGSEFNVTYGKDGSVSVSISAKKSMMVEAPVEANVIESIDNEDADIKLSKKLKSRNKSDGMYVTSDLQFVKNCSTVSKRMTDRRKYLGMSQRELSKKSEIRAGTISEIHKYGKCVSTKHLFKIAETLDCTVEYLLGITNALNPFKSNEKEIKLNEVVPAGFLDPKSMENFSEDTIGDRIRARRVRIGWSQHELAKRLGLESRTSISRLEHCTCRMNLSTIKKIAEALCCTEAYLLGHEADTSSVPKFDKPENVKRAMDDPEYVKTEYVAQPYIKASTVTLSPEFLLKNKFPWKSSLMVSGQGTEPNSTIEVTVVSQDKNLTPGDRIKYRRKSLNLSQGDIAKRLNIKNQSSIARYESVGKRIKIGTLDQFANALDCPAIYFMGIVKTTATTDEQGHVVSVDLPEFASKDPEFFKHL